MSQKLLNTTEPASTVHLDPTDLSFAHALARIGFGVNIASHGYTRIPGISGFAAGLEEQFAGTFLPGVLVNLSGYGIVIGEAVLGTLLVLGLFVRASLVAGMLLMILLLFGTCLLQNWGTAGTQMIYLGFYAVLLATAGYDGYSLDRWRR